VTRSLGFESSSVFKGIVFFAFLFCSFEFEHRFSYILFHKNHLRIFLRIILN
jgi:hypothetical protein